MGTMHEFRPTFAAWFWTITLTFGIGLLWAWWKRRGIRYEVTDSRVIKHTGRVSTKTDEFSLDNVSRIQTNKTLGEKILGGGTIIIDTGVDQMTLTAVPDHSEVVTTIREQL